MAINETIPIDILDAAEQAAADLDDIHFNSCSASWLDDARDIVAAALMAERERCAKIAEELSNLDVAVYSAGYRAAGRNIAFAIRTPSTGEER